MANRNTKKKPITTQERQYPAAAQPTPTAVIVADPRFSESGPGGLPAPGWTAAHRHDAQESEGQIARAIREDHSRTTLTNGLTADRAVALPEEQEEFDRFAAALRHQWQPQEPTERFYLDRMIHCAWRLHRMARIETSALIALCQKASLLSSQADPAKLGQAYIAGQSALQNLSRYERQIERSMREAHHELELIWYARATQVSPFYARKLSKFAAPSVDPFRRDGGQR